MRLWSCLMVIGLSATIASAGTLIDEDFSDISDWNDLSTAVTWGGNAGPVSAFTSTGGAVTLTSTAKSHAGYASADDLKTFTALDMQFGSAIDRTNPATNTITIDFRAKWSAGVISGEGSRFNITLNHDYPSGGLDMDLDDKYNDFTNDWWARPAYNARVRLQNDETLMMYGGGPDSEGEYEKYGSDWWLAGFSSGPGGHSPQPGTNGVVGAGTGLYSQSEYKDYRYVITPEGQEFWFDAAGDGFDAGDLRGTMLFSNWDSDGDGIDDNGFRLDFETIEGIRLYWRGAAESQAMLDSLTVNVTPEPATLVVLSLGGLGAVLRRRRRA